MTFENLGLSSNILRAVVSEGYKTPTAVQAQAIPLVLKGKDLLAGAQTGTGKTAAFTLPMLELIKMQEQRGDHKQNIKGLILTPTRELAEQVEKSIRTYGKYIGIKSTAVYGGVHISGQLKILRSGVDILVATPGRLLDHVKQQSISLSHVEIFVLDEADRMLDMGFVEDIERIKRLIPKKHQTLFFSATFSDEIKRLASSLLHEPEHIEIATHNSTADAIKQIVHPVANIQKTNLLIDLLEKKGWNQVLVFTRTKKGADELSARLKDAGVQAAAIHGDKPQLIRTKTLKSFKAGNIRVLVATDVASRGIDIDKLPCVVNYELPSYAEDYVHRIGRTGRGGNSGEAVSLVSNDEVSFLESIEKLIKKPIEKEVIEGYEYALRTRDMGGQDKRGNNNRRGNNSNNRNRRGSSSGLRSNKSYDDRPRRDDNFGNREDKPRNDRPRRDDSFGDKEFKPRSDRPRRDDSFGDKEFKPRSDRPRRDDSFGDKEFKPRRDDSFGDKEFKPRNDRPRRDDSFGDKEFKPRGDRPRRDDSFGDKEFKPRGDRPRRDDNFGNREDKPRGDRPRRDDNFGNREERPRSDRPRRDDNFGNREDKPRGDRPRRDDSFGNREERPRGDRPRRDDSFGNRDERPRGDRPRRDGGNKSFGNRDGKPPRGNRNSRPHKDNF